MNKGMGQNIGFPLDLFSTSQKTCAFALCFFLMKIPENNDNDESVWCVNNPPYFAIKRPSGRSFNIVRGCCNSWTCPRCGQIRAKKEYGRIAEGCRTLESEHEALYFVAFTCRGAGLSVRDADENYLLWTNRILSTFRANAKKRGLFWSYVQVTERQKRGMPHSHIITTWHPDDLRAGTRRKYYVDNAGKKRHKLVPRLLSDYMLKSVKRVGLGEQYDIEQVDTVEGASRYVAKYLFKETMFSDNWEKNWRRVRYSQSFPKLPEPKTSDAVVLLSVTDWLNMANACDTIIPDSPQTEAKARSMLTYDQSNREQKRKLRAISDEMWRTVTY